MKIKKVAEPYYKRIKITDSTLCCTISPEIQCKFCKKLMCKDCGRAWSGRKHFVLDMCRSRFTAQQLRDSTTCFKKRIVNGIVPTQLGDCDICKNRQTWLDTDRLSIHQPRRR